jgi:hypothetical protein
MVRRSRRGRVLEPNVLGDQASLADEARRSIESMLRDRSSWDRLGATLLFFLTTTPLILFCLLIGYQVWHYFVGYGLIDSWTFGVVLPFGVLFSPVLFYLGWYFQARAKGKQVQLELAMGGSFQAFCATLYGFLAVITIGLTIIGAVGTALVDSNVVLITWAGMALVGIGLVSWLFHSMRGDVRMLTTGLLISQPTGIALATFSAVWLYPCALAYRHQDWAQFRGAAIMFLVFLAPGCLSIWLSSRKHR